MSTGLDRRFVAEAMPQRPCRRGRGHAAEAMPQRPCRRPGARSKYMRQDLAGS